MVFCSLKSLLRVTNNARNLQLIKGFSGSSCSKPIENACKDKKIIMDPACKTAIITGGTGGIGFATAHELLANDAKVAILVGLDSKKGLDAVQDLNCAYGKDRAIFVKGDVRNKTEIDEILQQLRCEYGKLQIMVNCAGVWNDREWEKEVAVNLSGVINTSLAAEKFLHKENGVVVNLAGVLGLQPLPPSPIIAALHSGVIQFSKSLGHEINYRRNGIRFIALCPGITQTEFSKDADKRMRTAEGGRDLDIFLKKAHRQKPDVCAKSVLEVIKYGQSASTWVIEGSRLFHLNIPDWKQYSNLISQYT